MLKQISFQYAFLVSYNTTIFLSNLRNLNFVFLLLALCFKLIPFIFKPVFALSSVDSIWWCFHQTCQLRLAWKIWWKYHQIESTEDGTNTVLDTNRLKLYNHRHFNIAPTPACPRFIICRIGHFSSPIIITRINIDH